MKKETNIWAILGLVFAFFSQVLGLVFSIIALQQIKENPQKYKGRELAVAGLVISASILAIVIFVVVIISLIVGGVFAASWFSFISMLR